MIRKKIKKRNSITLFFALFIIIAILVVVLLEYIDFKNGKKSFFFTKLIPLKTYSDKADQFNTKFINVLNKDGIYFNYFKDKKNKYHFKIDINSKKFDRLISKINAILTKLKGKLELAEIQELTNKTIKLYRLKFRKSISHLILIAKLKKKVKKVDDKTPKIAIIIDDLGYSNMISSELNKLNIPITASILPDTPYANEEAIRLKSYNIEEMIHIPMQPKNSRLRYSRYKYITMDSSNEDIRKLIRRSKSIIPYSIGINNHEGSLITSNEKMMSRILKIIKEEDLFFIDSRTTIDTVAYDIAKKMKIKTAYRDVFLDHIRTYSHSVAQIKELTEIALQKGKAIAIGHTFKTTIKAIKDSVNYIKSRGVKIVYVSEILE